MKAVLGRKLGMTQVFAEDGRLVPVTVIEAGPMVVTQIKNKETDGYEAVQVAFGEVKDEFKDEHIHDVHMSEWLAWTPLLVLIFVFGVYPDLLFKYFATPVAQLFGA